MAVSWNDDVSMKKSSVALVATVFIFGLIALYLFAQSTANSSASQLRDFIVPLISIDGNIYTVENGKVLNDGKSVSDSTTKMVLLLAHAAVLNRIDPLFALDGTDPDKLGKSLQEMKDVVARILPFYNSQDALKIKNNLFPLDFLNSLADAESTRQILIKTPSKSTATEYYKKLEAAINLNTEYTKKMETLFKDPDITGDSLGRFGFIGGYSTPSKYASAMNKYRLLIEDRRIELEKRIVCLDEFSSECPSLKNAFAKLTQISDITFAPQDSMPEEVRDNQQLVKTLLATFTPSGPHNFPTVVLENSPCFINSRYTYYQTWTNTDSDGGRKFSLHVINDLYFYDSKTFKDVRVTPYVKKNIPYIYQPAANLYMCAESGQDLMRAITLDEIRARIPNIKDIALIAPSTVELGKKIIAQDTIYEAEIRAYVDGLASLLSARGEKKFLEKTNLETVLEVEKILLMWKQLSPRFDEVIRDVTSNENNVIRFGQKGAPIPLFTVMLARSLLPITLLSYNQSVAPHGLDITIPMDYDLAEFHLISYNNELKKTYSEKQIQDMMLLWARAENE